MKTVAILCLAFSLVSLLSTLILATINVSTYLVVSEAFFSLYFNLLLVGNQEK